MCAQGRPLSPGAGPRDDPVVVWPRSFWLSAAAVLGVDGTYARFLLVSSFVHVALLVALSGARPAQALPGPGLVEPAGFIRACRGAPLAPRDPRHRQGTHLLIGSPGGVGEPMVDLLACAMPIDDLDVVLAEVEGVWLPRPVRRSGDDGRLELQGAVDRVEHQRGR